jgi:hypothetical protein
MTPENSVLAADYRAKLARNKEKICVINEKTIDGYLRWVQDQIDNSTAAW